MKTKKELFKYHKHSIKPCRNNCSKSQYSMKQIEGPVEAVLTWW